MLNVWAAVGRVAKKTVNRTGSGTMFIKFTLAVQREKDKSGNRATDFIPCAIVGNSGAFFEKYIEVGAMISVRGAMQSGSYDGANGQKVYTYECFVTQYDLIVPVNSQANGQQMKPAPIAVPPQQPSHIQNFGAMQAAPMPPPPPQVENLPPPDPYDGMLPFSMY